MPTINPYGGKASTVAIKPQAAPLSFAEFQSKSQPKSNKVMPLAISISAPLVKPEHQE